MRGLYLLLFLILFTRITIYAQFNDSTHHFISFNSTGNINKTNSADSYFLNNALRFSIKKKRVVLNFNNGWLYGQQKNKLTNNDYSAALDFNLYQKTPGLYYWGLGNYTTSYSLKIVNQLQSGLGLAYNILDTEKAQLNISNGILYETSKIRLNDSTNQVYNTFRNSLRLYFKFTIKSTVTWDGTGFLQNSLNYKNDYIIRGNSNLAFKLNKWLSLNTSLRYNKLERTNSDNLLLSYGLKAEKFF